MGSSAQPTWHTTVIATAAGGLAAVGCMLAYGRAVLTDIKVEKLPNADIKKTPSTVVLNIYDLGGGQLAKFSSDKIGGFFHAGVEVGGKEWSFGATDPAEPDRTGLFWNEPAKCTMHRYKESIKLGETPLSPKEVEQAIEDLKPRWMGHSYSLVEKNCCHCAHALAAALRVPPPPSFLNRAAESADAVENATEAVALMVAPVVAKVGGTLDDLLGDKAQAAATVVKAQHLRLSKKANTMIVASVPFQALCQEVFYIALQSTDGEELNKQGAEYAITILYYKMAAVLPVHLKLPTSQISDQCWEYALEARRTSGNKTISSLDFYGFLEYAKHQFTDHSGGVSGAVLQEVIIQLVLLPTGCYMVSKLSIPVISSLPAFAVGPLLSLAVTNIRKTSNVEGAGLNFQKIWLGGTFVAVVAGVAMHFIISKPAS